MVGVEEWGVGWRGQIRFFIFFITMKKFRVGLDLNRGFWLYA